MVRGWQGWAMQASAVPFSHSVNSALLGVLEQGWQADSTTRMVLPRKPGRWDLTHMTQKHGTVDVRAE